MKLSWEHVAIGLVGVVALGAVVACCLPGAAQTGGGGLSACDKWLASLRTPAWAQNAQNAARLRLGRQQAALATGPARHLPAVWITTGAAERGANGVWRETGWSGGKPSYSNDAGYVLRWAGPPIGWEIVIAGAETLQFYYCATEDLPGDKWLCGPWGKNPAPRLTHAK